MYSEMQKTNREAIALAFLLLSSFKQLSVLKALHGIILPNACFPTL